MVQLKNETFKISIFQPSEHVLKEWPTFKRLHTIMDKSQGKLEKTETKVFLHKKSLLFDSSKRLSIIQEIQSLNKTKTRFFDEVESLYS